MEKSKTVQEHYDITDEDLDNLDLRVKHECGHYWINCQKFVHKVLKTPYDALSEPQRLWIMDILNEIQESKH